MEPNVLRFDRFELDLNAYQLRRSGHVVKLERLPMELLILLAQRQRELVTREQIRERLWGKDVFVDSRQGINTAICKLRAALHDSSERPRLLQTVAGRGYRLLAEVSGAQQNGHVPKANGGQEDARRRFSLLRVGAVVLAAGMALKLGRRYLA